MEGNGEEEEPLNHSLPRRLTSLLRDLFSRRNRKWKFKGNKEGGCVRLLTRNPIYTSVCLTALQVERRCHESYGAPFRLCTLLVITTVPHYKLRSLVHISCSTCYQTIHPANAPKTYLQQIYNVLALKSGTWLPKDSCAHSSTHLPMHTLLLVTISEHHLIG